MRNRVVIAVGVVVLVVASLIGWRSCGDSKQSSSGTATGSASAGSGGGNAGSRLTKPRGPAKPASLTGRVIEKASGRGIPGAVVSIARATLMREIMPTPEASLLVVADAQGVWTITPVLPGTYFIAATAVGFLPGVREKHVVGSGDMQTNIEIALDVGGTFVSGTVTDVLGGPIADARVTAKREDVFDLAGTADLAVITKTDGTYQLTLAEGDYELRATHDDYTSSRANLEVATTPLKRDFVLTPGAVIRGQVVARDTGKPVPGAWLLADSASGRGAADTTTRGDDDGNFVFRGLRPGAVSLSAQGQGYASASPTVVEVGIGEQVDHVRVLVDRAFTISGNVVRKSKPDEGVAGVQLGVFSLASQQFGIALEPTDDAGSFVIHGVRPASYMLFAGGEGNVPELGTPVDVVDKDVTGVVVEMSTGVTLAGRVEPPVAGARVTLALSGPVGLANMFEMMKAVLVHGETDADGAFKVANAPAGAFTLTAAAKSGDTGTLPLVIGDVDQLGLVVKLETRASISGRVVNDKGAPVADATVRANNLAKESMSITMGNEHSGGTTRADGSFKLVGLDAGSYSLSVRDNERGQPLKVRDSKAKKIELAKGQALANLVLTVEARDGVIRGVVVGGDHRPVADAWVTAERARPDFTKMAEEMKDAKSEDIEEISMAYEGPSKPVLTGADGRFVIDRLRRNASYIVVAEGPRGASRGEVKDVKAGTSVTITLLSLGTLTGKVTSDDGKPVTAYDIACDAPDQDDDRKTIDSKDGMYTFERLAPAAYECTVTADAGTATGKVDVPPGPAKLDLQLTRWGVITGRVIDVLSKKPVPGLMAMTTGGMDGGKVFEDMMRGRTPKTDANGVFTLARVPAGAGSLTIMSGEMTFTGNDSLAMKPYTITSGQRIDLGTIEVVAPRVGDAGTFGFATTIDETGKLVVSSVKADGPAALAGVREQDAITAVAGIPVATLTPIIAQRVLSSGTVGVGVPITLTLDRAGSPVEVALVSVKW